jgi:hypothetical protein
MPKGLATFGLTRQPIILLGLLLFVSGGHIAFRPLNNRYADTVALFQALCGDWRNRSDVDADLVRGKWGHTLVVVRDD